VHFRAVWHSSGRVYYHRLDARVREAAIHSQKCAAGNIRPAWQLTHEELQGERMFQIIDEALRYASDWLAQKQ
jgi:hypothetical protein